MSVARTAAILLGVAAAAAVITRWVHHYATARGVMDIPNDRSSHGTPTPRGGGVSIALAWVLGIPALTGAGLLPLPAGIGLTGGGLAVAAIGWWDDHVHLRPGIRFLVQIATAVWTVAWIGGFPAVRLGTWTWPLGAIGFGLAVVGLVWLINLYNFMDGIDGIAGVEAVTVGVIAGTILQAAGAGGLSVAAFGVAAAASGFLVWNWPPARIFMGDVGSYLLGYAFGALALTGERVAEVPAVVLLIPLAVFICDATFTLLRRMLRGERLHEAHRSHVYQLLVQAGWSHRRVTICVAAINVCLAFVAWTAWIRPWTVLWLVGASIAALAILGTVLMRRTSAAARGRPMQSKPSPEVHVESL